MVPDIFPSQLVILSTGQTYFDTQYNILYNNMHGHTCDPLLLNCSEHAKWLDRLRILFLVAMYTT